ncbi:MAG: sensor histidine kinase [Sphingomicrobium sp.]
MLPERSEDDGSRERDRLAAVARYEILDTPPDGAFDRITAIAARRFKVPISIISVVDHDRIWFKSHHGVEVKEIGRDPGLCASAILSGEAYVLTDASVDPRSLTNPLVAGEFGLRFYAGVPLTTHDGYNLGTLCVIDKAPRPASEEQIADLKDLASLVIDQLELRLAARRAVAKADLLAREIDHRVMNSLQFVVGLLNMQARTASGEMTEQLQDMAGRVSAVATVHRNFYSTDTDAVPCLSFLRRLCADVGKIASVSVDVEGDDTAVPTDWVQPIGLITNELVTNAAKQGARHVKVRFTSKGDTYRLIVADDGPGLAEDFSLDGSSGLGMKVLSVLAKQLGGELVPGSNPAGKGACFSLAWAKQ